MARSGSQSRLSQLLTDAVRGTFPPADGTAEILGAPAGAIAAVLALTGRCAIAAPLPAERIRHLLALTAGPDIPPAAAAMSPVFLTALGAELGARDDGVDVLLGAPELTGASTLRPARAGDHPRVARALAHRSGVTAYTDAAGTAVLTLGRGLERRVELSVEVEPVARGAGRAGAAITEARRLGPPGEPLFAQVAPGNATSLRAFLAAGFRPLGAEALFLA